MGLPKAILLDLDNTIYAEEPCHRLGLFRAAALAAAFDKLWSEPGAFAAEYARARDKVRSCTGEVAARHCRLLHFKLMVEARYGRCDFATVRSLHDVYWKGYLEAMHPDPGCAEAIAEMRSRGIRLAWVTNFTTEREIGKLQALRLAEVAEHLVTSEEAGAEKPSPAPFRLALSKLGVAPKDALFIGDDWRTDIQPALALGMAGLWLRRDPAEGPGGDVLSAASWREISVALFSAKKAA